MHSTVKLLPFTIFQKITNSYRKTHFFLLIKPIFARFENSYIFSGLVVQICSFYRFWKIQVFFRKTNQCLFKKNVNFERFEKSYWFGCILHQIRCFLGDFSNKNSRFFFSKNQSFFQEETTFLTLWETLLFQLHLITNFYLWRFFEKSLLFFRKTYKIYLSKPIFERFERSYLSNRILPQVCFVQRFFVKIHCLFSKHPPYFSIKKPKFRTFWEILLIQSHSKAFLLRLMIFYKKKQFFFEKHIDFN